MSTDKCFHFYTEKIIAIEEIIKKKSREIVLVFYTNQINNNPGYVNFFVFHFYLIFYNLITLFILNYLNIILKVLTINQYLYVYI